MKNYIVRVKNYIEGKKFNSRLREMNGVFSVIEKGGSLYYTCNGIAFEKIPGNFTSVQIVEGLNRARKSAQSYAFGETPCLNGHT